MEIEFYLIAFAVFVIRWLFSGYKENENKKKSRTPQPKKSPNSKKSIEDIFGDFMDEINQKKTPKPVFTNSDTHKAEDDSKELDWQEVRTSKFVQKEELLKNDNIRKPKTIDLEKITPIIESEEISNDDILEGIDLRKAVLYKEILERKYFSI